MLFRSLNIYTHRDSSERMVGPAGRSPTGSARCHCRHCPLGRWRWVRVDDFYEPAIPVQALWVFHKPDLLLSVPRHRDLSVLEIRHLLFLGIPERLNLGFGFGGGLSGSGVLALAVLDSWSTFFCVCACFWVGIVRVTRRGAFVGGSSGLSISVLTVIVCNSEWVENSPNSSALAMDLNDICLCSFCAIKLRQNRVDLQSKLFRPF